MRSLFNTLVSNAIPDLNVHDETMIMLSGALTIYLVADLRELARKSEATVPIEELEPPIQVNKVLDLIKDNKDALIKSSGYDEELEGRIVALENLTKHLTSNMMSKFVGKATNLIEFVDVNAKDELVHAITVNEAQRRITVVFRGSVTKTDFITDSKIAQTRVPNPVYNIDKDVPEDINLHYGFHEYLFKKKCPNDSSKSRIDSILNKVHSLLEENPGYSLYCTGHSLGGALCTLFGFYAASNPKTQELLKKNEPIKVISIASPYVGNIKFLQSFQSLERKGFLQHLRVANAEDVVTLMPVVGPKIGIVSPIMAVKGGVGNMYKHCGMKLQMKRKNYKHGKTYQIAYPQDMSSDESYAKEITNLMEDGKNFITSLGKVVKNDAKTVAGYHSCEEYERRLNLIKSDLKHKTLQSLYSDKSIVGKVLDVDYKPVYMMSKKEHLEKIKDSKIIKESLFGSKKEDDTDCSVDVKSNSKNSKESFFGFGKKKRGSNINEEEESRDIMEVRSENVQGDGISNRIMCCS
ncbi:hypothetical protein CTEN210_00853 [Chaetoceros tenuissimus]|uniref:Fungal lipase-type domain-containing protein n=1 Tax=Chaetoceros tenuissimus TaxID=426638 RepID=A0AAD3CEY3_9STRA|nr:hypothetical protein CTEN210_00853 [Chaetoceros tenuissimus]